MCSNRDEILVRCDYQPIFQFNGHDGTCFRKIHAKTSSIDATKEGKLVYIDGYSSSLNIVKHDDTEEVLKFHMET